MTRRLILALVISAAAFQLLAADLSNEMKNVEAIRALTFRGPVAQSRMTRKQFRKFLEDELVKSTPAPLPDYFDSLRALQLLDGGSDPLPQMLDLYQAQVLAFYDPQSHRYYQIIDPPKGLELPSGSIRLIVLHELTHALQDQRFDAGAREKRVEKDWDAQLAYQSVLEGEATLVMMGGLGETIGTKLDDLVGSGMIDQALSMTAASNEGIDPATPHYFVDSMKFPYVAGLSLVAAVYKKGGWDAVNELDRNPPQSSTEVIHPDLYFAHQTPTSIDPVSPAPAGEAEILTTTFGEYNWRFLIGDAAAKGWRGDRVRVFRAKDGHLSVLTDSVWNDPETGKRFADAYTAFLKGRGIDCHTDQAGVEVHVSYDVAKNAAKVATAPATAPAPHS